MSLGEEEIYESIVKKRAQLQLSGYQAPFKKEEE